MRKLIKAYKSMSDETRLRIVNLLMQKDCCVCEVMQALNISQPRASRNLRILYDSGFLQTRREGILSVYSVERDEMDPYLLDILDNTIETLKNNETIKHDSERLKQAKRIKAIVNKL
jgi:ArsR family transcriptional regulator